MVVGENYERRRGRLRAAIAEHERGDLDHAGLQEAIESLRDSLGDGHPAVREALFEADVTLEYAQDGHPADGGDPNDALRRMRRNLREALR